MVLFHKSNDVVQLLYDFTVDAGQLTLFSDFGCLPESCQMTMDFEMQRNYTKGISVPEFSALCLNLHFSPCEHLPDCQYKQIFWF